MESVLDELSDYPTLAPSGGRTKNSIDTAIHATILTFMFIIIIQIQLVQNVYHEQTLKKKHCLYWEMVESVTMTEPTRVSVLWVCMSCDIPHSIPYSN